MGDLVFIPMGRILYSNFALKSSFRFGEGQVAAHIVWRFWWIMKEPRHEA